MVNNPADFFAFGAFFVVLQPKINQQLFEMKKIVTILAASMMLLGIDAIAQPAVSAGYLRSIENTKVGSLSSTQPTDGFYAGIDVTMPITENLSFMPGIYYAMTSKKNVASIWGLKIEGARQTDHMINAPLMLNLGMDLSSDFRVFVYGGPTLSFGIASVYQTNNSSYNRYDSDDNLKRFDVMLGAGAGIEMMEKFRVTFGYDWGMLNRTSVSDVTVRRNQMRVGVAFLF